MFAITILGNNSAIPAHGRNPTAQILQTTDENYLIDCGEGTQNQLAKYKIKRSRINNIFISHLHGDHYFGLIGLITSMGLMSRTNDLHVYAPAALEAIIKIQLDAADIVLPYKIIFHALKADELIASDKRVTVHSFKVNHRIECYGFLFKENKNPRSIVPEKAKAYEIPEAFFKQLQRGEDYITKKGTIVPNNAVTEPTAAARSYAYCADTIYDVSIAEKIKGAHWVYHETTYLKDLTERAASRYHSTTEQAASIATLAGAKKLLIGHFSSKYETLDDFLIETQSFFPETELAIEGVTFRM
ncbi:ribonuclease Z [Ferruginibacter yonginensis]|uniref:Ribonuclease Z n=1 Tax=Ferruginibacter yonginensis TaxID=1310416 RepID=A0ABV8QR03_9BACT